MIWGRFLLIFALHKLNVRHISTSGLVDLLTYKVCHVMRTSWWKFPPSLKLIRSYILHPLPSYSGIAPDTLRDLVTLTFDLLTLVSGHTWRSRGQSLHQVWRSYGYPLWVLTSPTGYHWQCVSSHCACAVSCDLCVGVKFPHIFEIPDPDLPIHYTTFMALWWRLRVVYC